MDIKSLKNKLVNCRFRLYYSTLFKMKVWMARQANFWLTIDKPGSFPKITGDGVRTIANHYYDEVSTVCTKKVGANDVVFVRGDFLLTYFKKIHPKISNRYVLVSHNSDENIDSRFAGFADDKIIHWFGQNILINDPKVSPVPIGLSNFRYKGRAYLSELSRLSLSSNKKSLVLSCFSEETNAKRSAIKEELKKYSVVKTLEQLEQEDYLKTISEYKFIASPEGNGIDCHRTWEALYLRSIPIVERNATTEYFEKIGLPIVLVDDWKELETWDEKEITRKYDELKTKFDSEALYINYWFELISSKQNG